MQAVCVGSVGVTPASLVVVFLVRSGLFGPLVRSFLFVSFDFLCIFLLTSRSARSHAGGVCWQRRRHACLARCGLPRAVWAIRTTGAVFSFRFVRFSVHFSSDIALCSLSCRRCVLAASASRLPRSLWSSSCGLGYSDHWCGLFFSFRSIFCAFFF